MLTKLWLQDENALTQTKFELGITGIIQNVFQSDYTTKWKKNCWKLIIAFPEEGGENSMKMIFAFVC